MTAMRRVPTRQGIEFLFGAARDDGRSDPATPPPASLLPPARGRIAGGVVSVDMARPSVVTSISFESQDAADAVLAELVITRDGSDLVIATDALGALVEMAIAEWWLQWCPNPVPRGILLADVGITSWRAGMGRAAFDALASGGAAAIGWWLREAADSSLPSKLVEMLRADAADAIEVLGPNQEHTPSLTRLLSNWDEAGGVPNDAGEFEDLWRTWDVAQSASAMAAPDLAAVLGGAAFAVASAPMSNYAIGALSMPTGQDGSEPIELEPASVDWHAVPPGLLVSDEGTIRATVDLRARRVEITVEVASDVSADQSGGLVAQLVDPVTGEPLVDPLPMKPAPSGVLRAVGRLPAGLKPSGAGELVPYVRHVSYTGRVRTGSSAAAARAQRDAIRATVAFRTDVARDWLGLEKRPALAHQVRTWMADARLSLSEAVPDGDSPASLPPISELTSSVTADGDHVSAGLPLPDVARSLLLVEAFLALAEER